jgi:hypothetical protein
MVEATVRLSRRRLRGCVVACVWAVMGSGLLGADRAAASKTFSPVERMTTARLKAAHDDVIRIQQSRRTLPPRSGLNDYRAILHAHAEDSAHTGGTRPEMLADAKRAGVHAILLTDHHRPPKDFIRDSWRGSRDGVLFVPGSEARGFLLYPTRSIMDSMNRPAPEFIADVRAEGGLIFLSHIEERPDHPMTGLDGLEIYNSHAQAKKNGAGLLAVMLKLTDPASLKELEENLRHYPQELFAAQSGYPGDYLAKWDAETKTRRLTGVAANDCHHNLVLLVKMVDPDTVEVGTTVDRPDQFRRVSATLRPGIREMTKGHKPGDMLARVDIDPYERSFQSVSTHILASELSESAMRAALREGHAYVSHDWMCDPTGFRFALHLPRTRGTDPDVPIVMGGEAIFSSQARLIAEFPVSCRIRLLKGGRVIAEHSGDHIDQCITEPGVYRVEGWLEIGGEERPWLYSNPIYVRAPANP